MRNTHDIRVLAAASTAATLLAVAGAPAALGASTPPVAKLTKTSAAAAARKDTLAAAAIYGGDKVVISGCRTYGKSAYKCSVLLVPQSSASRCRWTDTIRLVKGKLNVTPSAAGCSG